QSTHCDVNLFGALHDELGQLDHGRMHDIDFIQLHPLGSSMDKIENVVENGSQALDVFAIERSDECASHFFENFMRDIVTPVFKMLDLFEVNSSLFRRRMGEPFIQHFGDDDEVGRCLLKKRVKFFVFGNEELQDVVGGHMDRLLY